MKFPSIQLTDYLKTPQARRNLAGLLGYVGLVAGVVVFYSFLFQLIMVHFEGDHHTWISGLYWTVVTMSTLGFGDIVFQTDVGRLFSIIVLLSGMVLLLVLLPYLFIRLILVPWFEARVRLRAPREALDLAEHVIICRYDSTASTLVAKLEAHGISYVVLESDPAEAAAIMDAGVRVVAGEPDNRSTYERVRVERARLVLANVSDTANTNIMLTVREVSPDVPLAAIVTEEESVDILELSGCNHVLPLRRRLGEHLANRVNAGHARLHIIGSFNDILVAEFPVEGTPLANRTVRDTGLRAATGMSIVAVGEKGKMRAASPDTLLTDRNVAVVMGTETQLDRLNELLIIYRDNFNPVVVVGGGEVGLAAVRALKRDGISVHMVEREPDLPSLKEEADRLFVGDAADRSVLVDAGLLEAPSVLLTTHDDAMNIYLSVYCRRLNPPTRIISRITHERNIEAVLRAGADFVLSYDGLAADAVLALLHRGGFFLLGEGVDLFRTPVPESLKGVSLGDSGIGSRTGLNVIAVEEDGCMHRSPASDFRLMGGAELLMLGDVRQRRLFDRFFG